MFNGNYHEAQSVRSAKPSRLGGKSSSGPKAKRLTCGAKAKSRARKASKGTRGEVGGDFQINPAPVSAPEPNTLKNIKLPLEGTIGLAASQDGVLSALSAFMRDAAAVPLLSPEQEVDLAGRIQKGDDEAREHMIRANLRLVVKIARDYEHLGLPLLDLISEGTIGLMKAVDRFDPAKGGKLSTYGSWWIKQQIRRALANQGRTIRLPVHVEAKIYRLGRAEARLREVLGREATDDELAGELGMDTRRITRLRSSAIRPGSLDAPLGDDDSSTIAEVVGDERANSPAESFRQKSDHSMLVQLLDRLPDREAHILRRRFGLDGEDEQTLEQLGEEFGLTRERIRQLQMEAFKKLREMLENPERIPMAA